MKKPYTACRVTDIFLRRFKGPFDNIDAATEYRFYFHVLCPLWEDRDVGLKGGGDTASWRPKDRKKNRPVRSVPLFVNLAF
jgi:hypothetical protein